MLHVDIGQPDPVQGFHGLPLGENCDMSSKSNRAFFQEHGYLIVEKVVSSAGLEAIQAQFQSWVEESRGYTAPWGTTVNGKPRFDLEAGHTAARPALRRVNAPVEISDSYFRVMSDGTIPQIVADLVGPDVRFHHSKVNSKLPGSATQVKWHQDFGFTPHTNDDVVTALVFVDEVTTENGPLKVLPGSHRGEMYSLWHDGQFTGAVSEAVATNCENRAVICTGPAGSVCFMHTRLLHASAANRSTAPRTLFICVYSADDAVPLSPNPMPSQWEGMMVAGQHRGRVRSVPFDMRLPELPQTASFFDQQFRRS